MEKLIIVCCVNDTVGFKGIEGLHMPMTVREVADSVRAARDAGASIAHVHQPLTAETGRFMGSSVEQGGARVEGWLQIRQLIGQESDIIFEHGTGGLPYFYYEHHIPPAPDEVRDQKYDMGVEKPDMIAMLLGPIHHDYGGPRGIYVMPTREEMERWNKLCLEKGVKPSFEVWGVGDYNNLQWLIDRGAVEPPYWCSLVIGATSWGGSQPTIEEVLHRIKYLPENAMWLIDPCCGTKGLANTQQQLALFAWAITLGGHVRVGMEDNPYYWDGVPAESNAQLVERVVRIARELGREVATPAEARQMLGLPRRA